METEKEPKPSKINSIEEQNRRKRSSYWEQLLNKYEKRNAKLEARQAALTERVKFMECALPSLLMGAVINSTQKKSERSRSRTCDSEQYNTCNRVNEDCQVDN